MMICESFSAGSLWKVVFISPGSPVQLGFDIVMTDLGIGTRMDDRQEGAGGTAPDSIG